MAEADLYTKNYISQNDVFADVFTRSLRERNEFLFRFAKQKLAFFIWGGRQVIKPDALSDESVEEGSVLLAGEESESAQRYRDVLKSCVIKRDAFAVRTLRVWHS